MSSGAQARNLTDVRSVLHSCVADLSEAIPASATVNLEGKGVLVTGGAAGLGAAYARAAAQKGALVTVVDVSAEVGNEFVEELTLVGFKAQFVQADVTDYHAQLAAFKAALAFGPLDHAIANAGVKGNTFPEPSTIDRDTDPPEPVPSQIQTSLIGAFYTAYLANHYIARPSAEEGARVRSLTLIGSLAGYSGLPWRPDYTAAKFGMRGIMRSLRQPLITTGMRVNLIAPGYVETSLTAGRHDDVKSRGFSFIPLEQAVDAVMRVLADARIHGRSIAVNGGGNVDMRDDIEGLDGGLVREYFVEHGTSPASFT